MSDRIDKAPEIAEHFGISRSEARRHIVLETCPCGHPGAHPCWRMGGEAGCATIVPETGGPER